MIRILLLPISILAAILAQVTGYSGTCTEGTTDSWLAGAASSLPFFCIILLLAGASLVLRQARRPWLDKAAFAIVAAGSIGLLIANMGMLKAVLVDGASLCGADFGPATREDYTIAVIYGLFPLLAFAVSIGAISRVQPAPAQ